MLHHDLSGKSSACGCPTKQTVNLFQFKNHKKTWILSFALLCTWRGNLKQSCIYNNEFLSCQVPSWGSRSKLPSNIIGVSWLFVYMYTAVRYINSPARLPFSANGFESGRDYNNYRYVGPGATIFEAKFSTSDDLKLGRVAMPGYFSLISMCCRFIKLN